MNIGNTFEFINLSLNSKYEIIELYCITLNQF